MNLENLTENQTEHLKVIANRCYMNESDFRTIIAIRVVEPILNIALNTHWDDRASVAEYKEYAITLLKRWFPYLTDERLNEEVSNIRTKNTINMNKIVGEMRYLNAFLNKKGVVTNPFK